MEKDLRGADVAAELSLQIKEGLAGAEGQQFSHLCYYLNLNLPNKFCLHGLNEKQQNPSTVFPPCDFAPVSAPGVLKADVTQGPLVSLSSSTSEQASTSKQQYPVEQQLYGASGSRDDIFSLGGPSYMTASKNCGSRTLGCVSGTHTQGNVAVWLQLMAVFLKIPQKIFLSCFFFFSALFLLQGSHVGL